MVEAVTARPGHSERPTGRLVGARWACARSGRKAKAWRARWTGPKVLTLDFSTFEKMIDGLVRGGFMKRPVF